VGEEASGPAPDATTDVQRRASAPMSATGPIVQLGKVRQISSDTGPDMGVIGKLESKSSKQARLVRYTQWLRKRRKHTKGRYRKYVAIRHRNLMHDTVDEDLVLLLRLKRRTNLTGSRDSHYAAIEAKGGKKGQTAQNRTELLGEAVAAIRMEQYLGSGATMLVGFA